MASLSEKRRQPTTKDVRRSGTGGGAGGAGDRGATLAEMAVGIGVMAILGSVAVTIVRQFEAHALLLRAVHNVDDANRTLLSEIVNDFNSRRLTQQVGFQSYNIRCADNDPGFPNGWGWACGGPLATGTVILGLHQSLSGPSMMPSGMSYYADCKPLTAGESNLLSTYGISTSSLANAFAGVCPEVGCPTQLNAPAGALRPVVTVSKTYDVSGGSGTTQKSTWPPRGDAGLDQPVAASMCINVSTRNQQTFLTFTVAHAYIDRAKKNLVVRMRQETAAQSPQGSGDGNSYTMSFNQ